MIDKHFFCSAIMDLEYQGIKIIKRKGDKIICFVFMRNNTEYFGKLIRTDMLADFIKERDINIYISNNIKNSKYHTKILEFYENIMLADNLAILARDTTADAKYNLMIFEYSGKHPLRYYINKLSRANFDKIILQLREATNMLNYIGVIHYDLYCESNVMLKKDKDEWVIKIVDYGLSYIDFTDKKDSDYNNIIESIEHFSKKHNI